MATAALFRAGIRACGMNLTEFSGHFGYPIKDASLWKKRGAPDEVMEKLGLFHKHLMQYGSENDYRLPDGCRGVLAFKARFGAAS